MSEVGELWLCIVLVFVWLKAGGLGAGVDSLLPVLFNGSMFVYRPCQGSKWTSTGSQVLVEMNFRLDLLGFGCWGRETLIKILNATYQVRQMERRWSTLEVSLFVLTSTPLIIPQSKDQEVETAWEYSHVFTAFNAFVDADACCTGSMTNAAFVLFSHSRTSINKILSQRSKT